MLPCPFCASDNCHVMEKPGHPRLWVECLDCGSSGPDVFSWDGAEESWNIRGCDCMSEQFENHTEIDEVTLRPEINCGERQLGRWTIVAHHERNGRKYKAYEFPAVDDDLIGDILKSLFASGARSTDATQ